jgi:hypothetical protein
MGKYVNKLNSKQQDSVKDQTNVNNNQLFLNKNIYQTNSAYAIWPL